MPLATDSCKNVMSGRKGPPQTEDDGTSPRPVTRSTGWLSDPSEWTSTTFVDTKIPTRTLRISLTSRAPDAAKPHDLRALWNERSSLTSREGPRTSRTRDGHPSIRKPRPPNESRPGTTPQQPQRGSGNLGRRLSTAGGRRGSVGSRMSARSGDLSGTGRPEP